MGRITQLFCQPELGVCRDVNSLCLIYKRALQYKSSERPLDIFQHTSTSSEGISRTLFWLASLIHLPHWWWRGRIEETMWYYYHFSWVTVHRRNMQTDCSCSQGTHCKSIGPFDPTLKCAFNSLSSLGILFSQTGEIQGGWGPVQRDSDSRSWERVWICWW